MEIYPEILYIIPRTELEEGMCLIPTGEVHCTKS